MLHIRFFEVEINPDDFTRVNSLHRHLRQMRQYVPELDEGDFSAFLEQRAQTDPLVITLNSSAGEVGFYALYGVAGNKYVGDITPSDHPLARLTLPGEKKYGPERLITSTAAGLLSVGHGDGILEVHYLDDTTPGGHENELYDPTEYFLAGNGVECTTP